MRTLSGKKLNILYPTTAMIEISDIAQGLSNNSHFAGQIPHFFSIAQHSVMVCDEYATSNPEVSDDMKLLALMHDASEGYLGDVIKPLKIYLPDFVRIEKRLMMIIANRYNLPIERIAEIKQYDLLVQNIEYNAFYRNAEIDYMESARAYRIFLDRFNEYYHGQ
jgi:5'-deoxynucleotidase YfbR-like HD superfamily hydrolase